MAALNYEIAKRLFTAVRTEGLRLRNWSLPGEWVFAIYTWDDSYIGAVCLDEGTGTLRIYNPDKCAKKERASLARLCTAFAEVAS